SQLLPEAPLCILHWEFFPFRHLHHLFLQHFWCPFKASYVNTHDPQVRGYSGEQYSENRYQSDQPRMRGFDSSRQYDQQTYQQPYSRDRYGMPYTGQQYGRMQSPDAQQD
ncbi:MAG: hypothetical protein M0P57_15295, partial [Syntrophales bacterium]|nr:hypothetical protein [Syntrophales bacterium]